MRLTHTLSGALLAFGLAFAASPVIHAAPTQAADLAAFRSFTLNESFLDKWKAAQADTAKDPCNLGIVDLLSGDDEDENGPPLDQLVASFEAKPGVQDMLERNGLSARDYLLGSFTMLAAAVQEMARQHPEMIEQGYIEASPAGTVSEANMAFYRQHQADILQLTQKLSQQAGDKLLNCAG